MAVQGKGHNKGGAPRMKNTWGIDRVIKPLLMPTRTEYVERHTAFTVPLTPRSKCKTLLEKCLWDDCKIPKEYTSRYPESYGSGEAVPLDVSKPLTKGAIIAVSHEMAKTLCLMKVHHEVFKLEPELAEFITNSLCTHEQCRTLGLVRKTLNDETFFKKIIAEHVVELQNRSKIKLKVIKNVFEIRQKRLDKEASVKLHELIHAQQPTFADKIYDYITQGKGKEGERCLQDPSYLTERIESAMTRLGLEKAISRSEIELLITKQHPVLADKITDYIMELTVHERRCCFEEEVYLKNRIEEAMKKIEDGERHERQMSGLRKRLYRLVVKHQPVLADAITDYIMDSKSSSKIADIMRCERDERYLTLRIQLAMKSLE